jgi:Zn-finger nucleic acid-binding protein
MNCPVDGRELLLTHREGIELDYCPECRGIWFDRGELDKVIERSNLQLNAASVPRDRSSDRDERSYDKQEKYEKPKKKKATSFLSDLLEFG